MRSEFQRLVKESRSSYWLARYASRGKKGPTIAIDMGMNVGSFAYVYGDFFDDLVGIDASSKCISLAQQNLHHLNNVKYVHAALDSESGRLVHLRRVYVSEKWESKDLTTFQFDPEASRQAGYLGELGEIEETTASISFGDLLGQIEHKRVNFLKVDIEGAEYQTLIGADLNCVDALVMEVHHTFLGKAKVRELVTHMLKHLQFVDSRDEARFVHSWPPPDLLVMYNPAYFTGNALLQLKIRTWVARCLRKLAEVLRRRLWD